MRCVNRLREEEWSRYVAENRVDVDRFEGLTDVVEILKHVHTRHDHDPLKNYLPYRVPTAQLYRELGHDDADRLLRAVAENTAQLAEVARHLSCFSTVDRNRCQHMLLDLRDTYPHHVFRDANEVVVARLFKLLNEAVQLDDDRLIDHALCGLVWTRSPRVITQLSKWAKTPPRWASLLYLAPHKYTLEAGYEIEDGRLRELTLSPAYALVASTEQDTDTISLFEPDRHGARCPRCSGSVVTLFRSELSTWPEHMRKAIPSHVPTCLGCAIWGAYFVHLSGDGWSWIPEGESSAKPPVKSVESDPCRVALVRRPDAEAVDHCASDAMSQIGGLPGWINDAMYPHCPRCDRSMLLVAQIQPNQFQESVAGIYYVHHCPECSVVGVGYEQS